MTADVMAQLVDEVVRGVEGVNWLSDREYGKLDRSLRRLLDDADLPTHVGERVINASGWLWIFVDEVECREQGGRAEVRRWLLEALAALRRTIGAPSIPQSNT